ncbi:hypothetical protein BpHYR1_044193 [Brachionus plicatilis]|uniref:Uncharacterized protein n=1 Tax=Brachionus plicatilis TaxID=10195 RepID=A0A3M7PBN5_BRAPC|nr:hypothetical protein BpHYR1_044193 [Brachionus plicatilis]
MNKILFEPVTKFFFLFICSIVTDREEKIYEKKINMVQHSNLKSAKLCKLNSSKELVSILFNHITTIYDMSDNSYFIF